MIFCACLLSIIPSPFVFLCKNEEYEGYEEYRIFLCALVSTTSLWASNAKELKLASPDGAHTVCFQQQQRSAETNEIYYRVSYKGLPVLEDSRAGIDLDNRIWEMALGIRDLKQPACWMDNLEVDSVTYSSADASWKPLYGERSTIRDAYNAATMYLSKKMVPLIG